MSLYFIWGQAKSCRLGLVARDSSDVERASAQEEQKKVHRDGEKKDDREKILIAPRVAWKW